ncbi:ABC transporter permease [Rhodovibrionaceae bacterium A322]
MADAALSPVGQQQGSRSQASPGKPNKPFSVRYQPGFTTVALLCFLMLYAPMIALVIYSFNGGETIAIWQGFSWRWYESAINNREIQQATVRSLQLAGFATVVATTVATMAALATTRCKPFKGFGFVYGLINQPLMVPEIVTAVALMVFFAIIKVSTGYQGMGYLFAAHSAFCIPFAYMPIRARLEDMNLTLEQAAADLYATPWQTFRRVTLPLLMPGIMAGAMLAFVISLDDVVITLFVAGPGQETLPLYVIGQLRRIVTPEMNAVSSLFLLVSSLLVTLFFFLNWKRD